MHKLETSVFCRSILVSLASNEQLEGVELNLSSNALGASGCQLLETVIADMHCLSSLDVSDNGFCLFCIFDRHCRFNVRFDTINRFSAVPPVGLEFKAGLEL